MEALTKFLKCLKNSLFVCSFSGNKKCNLTGFYVSTNISMVPGSFLFLWVCSTADKNVLTAGKRREHQTHQSFHRTANTHRQSLTVATLVLRCNNKQEMWVVLTRNGFHFVHRIS